MTTAMLALTAVFIGALLGMRFNALIMVPAVIVSFVAILGVRLAFDDSVWFALLAAVLTVTALQIGYLAGSLIGLFVAATRTRKSSSGLMVFAQRLFRHSAQT
jgi:hydrogenase/urease accessory protein HupE